MSEEKRTIENAPEIFRERLKKLDERGLLRDPKFLQAIRNAAERVAEEQADAWAEAKKNDKLSGETPRPHA